MKGKTRPDAVAAQLLDAIPAPSTATAKTLLAPGKAFLEDPADAAAGGDVGQQPLVPKDRRLSVKCKLDLARRLHASKLGSLLFVHAPPVLGDSHHRPASARETDRGVRDVNRPGVRPVTARPAMQQTAFDLVSRRVNVGDDASSDLSWRASGNPGNEMHNAIHAAKTPRTAREKLLQREADVAALKEAGLWRRHESAPEREQSLLRCGVNFKCQPDPRWKALFQTTALELQQAAELDRKYVEDMRNYSGRQVSRARVILNTPKEEGKDNMREKLKSS
jgi:hypothetical protein